MEIHVVVHPIDEANHPGAGGFIRWAVHIGTDWADPDSCLNAGAELDQVTAAQRGQAVAVAAARVAERCKALTGGDTHFLGYDPLGAAWPILEVKEI